MLCEEDKGAELEIQAGQLHNLKLVYANNQSASSIPATRLIGQKYILDVRLLNCKQYIQTVNN